MSILSDIVLAIAPLHIPVETGVFSGAAPDEYIVLIPLSDGFAYSADDAPQVELSEVQLSLFTKSNYLETKKQLTKLLLLNGLTITDRRYMGHEDDTGYHFYVIDIANIYEMEEE